MNGFSLTFQVVCLTLSIASSLKSSHVEYNDISPSFKYHTLSNGKTRGYIQFREFIDEKYLTNHVRLTVPRQKSTVGKVFKSKFPSFESELASVEELNNLEDIYLSEEHNDDNYYYYYPYYGSYFEKFYYYDPENSPSYYYYYDDYTPVSNSTLSYQSQINYLRELYQSLNGDSWTRNDNWLNVTTSFCNWYGVYCNDKNEVSALFLAYNTLDGNVCISLCFTFAVSSIPIRLQGFRCNNVIR
jgi:hypothetical protein